MPPQITPRTLPLDSLDPQPVNPNRLSEARQASLRESMRAHGCLEPVVVVPAGERFRIVSGHHRTIVARDLGWTEIACLVAELSPEQERKVLLGMNRIRGDLRVDLVEEVLSSLLEDFACDPAMLASTGYSESEIEALTADLAAEAEEIDRSVMGTEEPAQQAVKAFRIEIEFADGALYRKTLRALRKASGGRGGDLAVGLMRVLEIEGEP